MSTGVRSNHLLASLPEADLALLTPHLVALDLPLRMDLELPNEPIEHIYFPETGLASVVATGPGDKQIEAGVIGREGMTGTAVVMGSDRSPNATYVQMSGRGCRLQADILRRAVQESSTLHAILLRFAQAFMAQTVFTALANGRGTLEQRLARWLLMAHDRVDGDELPLTHEFLAIMLGVRRPGVTTALHILEGTGLVAAHRGIIVVQNRKGLEQLAHGLYGVPEAEYRRLTGWHPAR